MPSAGAPNVSPAAAAAAAAAAVASGFYDYPSAYATQFANGFDTTFPFGGAAAAAAGNAIISVTLTASLTRNDIKSSSRIN